jgi:hypothetical protein
VSSVSAQTNIPLGTWRTHISYNNIESVTAGNNKIYAAALNGILVLDRDDNSITTYSKINGLAGTAISFINYDLVTNQLLIAYADGDLDIIRRPPMPSARSIFPSSVSAAPGPAPGSTPMSRRRP